MATEALTNALGMAVVEHASPGLAISRWQHRDGQVAMPGTHAPALLMCLLDGAVVTSACGRACETTIARSGRVTVPASDCATTYTVRGDADILCVCLSDRRGPPVRPIFLGEQFALARVAVRALALLLDGEREPLAMDKLRVDLETALTAPPIDCAARGGLSPSQLRRVNALIEDAAHAGRSPSLTELADEARVSIYHFAREFRRSLGKSPYAFSLERRIERARALLIETDTTITMIGYRCGFTSAAHFVRCFRAVIGVPPGRYRGLMRLRS